MTDPRLILIRGAEDQVLGEPLGVLFQGDDPEGTGGIISWSLLVADAEGTGLAQNLGGDNQGTAAALRSNSFNWLFNGSSYDRERNNTEETVLASGARTVATDSAAFTNYNAKGAHFIVDVSAIAGATITPSIQGQDPVSLNWYTILQGLPITTVSTNILKVYPGIGAIPNGAAADLLPRTWRVSVAVADANSATYSIGASLVV